MMKVATYNIHFGVGVGVDGRCDVERIVDAVRSADIIALQEVEVNWHRSGNIDQPSVIASLLPDHEVAWGPTVDVRKPLPEGRAAGRRQFGNMILSRFPVTSIRNHLLPKYGAASVLDMQKGALEALIETPFGPVRIYSLHLCHVSEHQRAIQIRRLLDIHDRAVPEGPVISGSHPTDASWSGEAEPIALPHDTVLLGDFNCGPGSSIYATLVGDLSARFGHVTRRGGFVDAWCAAGNPCNSKGARGEDLGATLYESFADKIGQRIDFCFLTERLSKLVTAAEVSTDADGSDHQPLTVTLARKQAA
jgi:endonuclease/exonuclease/phosphatase family metal-dependent hydrolase